MAFRRQDTNYVTTAANANAQSFNAVLVDGYRTLHVQTLYVNIATAGVSVALLLNGKQKCKIDCVRFANGNEPVHVEFDIPNNQTLVFVVQDLAGAAHANLGIVLGYDVDNDA